MTNVNSPADGSALPTALRPYAVNALMLSFIVYPAPEQEKLRQTAAASLRSRYVQWLHAHEGDGAKSDIDLEDAFRPAPEVAKGLSGFEARLRLRLEAGNMACAFLKTTELTPGRRELPRIGKLTVSNVTAHFGEMSGLDERRARRVFSDAYPILTYCSALAVGLQHGLRTLGGPKDIYEHMHDRLFAPRVVNEASMHLDLLKRTPALRKAYAAITAS